MKNVLALIIVLGFIGVTAIVIKRYDDLFLEPICRRFGEEKQMEYASHHGFARRTGTYCTYKLYNADGSYKTTVQVSASRMGLSPIEYLLVGPFRLGVILVILIPAVWLGRKILGMDD